MALLSGKGSSLNPNARPFIPAVYRQVEDFSLEWWNLVQNSTTFRDYWMSERQETNFEELSDTKDDDITNLLPDTFDIGYDDFPYVDAEYENSISSFKTYNRSSLIPEFKPQNGLGVDSETLMRNLNLRPLSPKGRGTAQLVERSRYEERPIQRMSFNHGTRRIHQPR